MENLKISDFGSYKSVVLNRRRFDFLDGYASRALETLDELV